MQGKTFWKKLSPAPLSKTFTQGDKRYGIAHLLSRCFFIRLIIVENQLYLFSISKRSTKSTLKAVMMRGKRR